MNMNDVGKFLFGFFITVISLLVIGLLVKGCEQSFEIQKERSINRLNIVYQSEYNTIERVNINGVNYLFNSQGGIIKEDKQ